MSVTVDDSRPTAGTHGVLRPGRNCWRVSRADRVLCIQDAADYFRLVRQAVLAAHETVFIVGWDILANLDLLPGAEDDGAPARLDQLIAFAVRRRPRLRCYILVWDHAALFAIERDPFTRWRFGWRMPRRVRFAFDDHLPSGASHHQKVVVIDDRLAFCGSTDLTGHRWDTTAHRLDEPARANAIGQAYEPYHEVHAMLTGKAAADLGTLARERWRALGQEPMPPVSPGAVDPWPADLAPDLTDVSVGISRTVPALAAQTAVREAEALFLDTIASARRSLYIESQYFTNDRIGAALAARLREADGPEIVVVVPMECYGWLERQTMLAFRDEVFRGLLNADVHGRLRLVYPAASQVRGVSTFVHSKVMVADDTLLRIGSANISRRSMGVDTECDLAVEAADTPGARAGIARILHRLLAEHLGLPVDEVASAVERLGSLRALIDTRSGADRTLAPVVVPPQSEPPEAAVRAASDPADPSEFSAAVELWPTTATRRRQRRVRMPALLRYLLGLRPGATAARRHERAEFF